MLFRSDSHDGEYPPNSSTIAAAGELGGHKWSDGEGPPSAPHGPVSDAMWAKGAEAKPGFLAPRGADDARGGPDPDPEDSPDSDWGAGRGR